MTIDDQHSELANAWTSLNDLMDRFPSLIRWDGVHYGDLTDMADRVRGLAIHLDSAVLLASKFRYDSALALLRTGLEQAVLDWLVFQGRTLVQRYRAVDEEKWNEWQEARAAKAGWTTDIREWTRTKKGEVRVVREGLYSEPDSEGNRRQISIYYFLLEQYRPTMGPPSAQAEDWAISRDKLRTMASENQALWHDYLTWSSLIENLKENKLVDDVDAGRLAAHYRFLSGYAHPVVDHRRESYGQHGVLGWPHYDHYNSELVLLYAATLGVLEVRNILRSLDGRPIAGLSNADDVEQVLNTAQMATSHFWFLGTHPHRYDTWKAHNEACFRVQRDGASAPMPPEPAPEDVPYPADPLQRLVALHSSARELMTGLAYLSPWPRIDAAYR